MSHDMLKFTQIDLQTPPKHSAKARVENFDEIYAPYDPDDAEAQASRCSQCGVPFCQQGCPLSNNIPDWLMLAAKGRLEEAYHASSATNNMPEICGRICPQDRLCEGSCVIEQSGHGTVTIGAVEKYITDTAWQEGWIVPIKPPVERAQSIGIIGAGPAGLAAAEELRRKGYQVTIYDRYDRGGGLLVYGIPGFKLEKHVVERRLDHLEAGGIQFNYKTEIGKDVSFSDLRARHDAVLIATGVYKPRALSLPEAQIQNCVEALDFLTVSNRIGLGDTLTEAEANLAKIADKDVVVIGGGDTTMDCVRTAIRLEAASVTCLYRRDQKNMPGSAREVQNAQEEGVQFEWLALPEEIGLDADQHIQSITVHRMKLGEPDPSGRQKPEKTGTIFERPADMVISALGFDAEDLPLLWDEPHLRVNRWGAVHVDYATMMTSLEGVFAAGDIVRGGSLVVWAIKDGRDAAASVHQYLQEQAERAPLAAE